VYVEGGGAGERIVSIPEGLGQVIMPKAWARIRGYVSTARKHGITAFDAIHAAIIGNPWTPTPSPAT
jgi:hypothetical protein